MIPQLLLTVALGIGVLTLATIGVFNTAGLRIHDHVKVGDERKGSRTVPTFSHVYWGDQAQHLRIALGNLPRTAMAMAAALAIVLLAVGFTAHVRVVDQGNPQGVYPYVLVILSATSAFVAGALYCAYRVSRKLYTVMHECLPTPSVEPPDISDVPTALGTESPRGE